MTEELSPQEVKNRLHFLNQDGTFHNLLLLFISPLRA